MQYVIMNRNALEGYQKGYFEQVPPCFYEGATLDDNDNVRYSWTPVLGEANLFNTEAQAWHFVRTVWGMKFAHTNYLIISVHKDALDRSSAHSALITERYSNG
jgi:hypothetical protein